MFYIFFWFFLFKPHVPSWFTIDSGGQQVILCKVTIHKSIRLVIVVKTWTLFFGRSIWNEFSLPCQSPAQSYYYHITQSRKLWKQPPSPCSAAAATAASPRQTAPAPHRLRGGGAAYACAPLCLRHWYQPYHVSARISGAIMVRFRGGGRLQRYERLINTVVAVLAGPDGDRWSQSRGEEEIIACNHN